MDVEPLNDAVIGNKPINKRQAMKSFMKSQMKAQNKAMMEWFRFVGDTDPKTWKSQYYKYDELFAYYIKAMTNHFSDKGLSLNVVCIKSTASSVEEDTRLRELFTEHPTWSMLIATPDPKISPDIALITDDTTLAARTKVLVNTEVTVNGKCASTGRVCMSGTELMSALQGNPTESGMRPDRKGKFAKRIHILRLLGETSDLELAKAFTDDAFSRRSLPLIVAMDVMSTGMPQTEDLEAVKKMFEKRGYMVSSPNDFFPWLLAVLKKPEMEKD
eukprot:CAMPEP_0182429066 /NCGR_PEP_ID=MMETSP1167-20130531/25486_1 /TAXON_ID=2988 /ORGANISM="Mallomonas Sp, Strain CCMP3275" /LENGTH=272 /DNA_ID=CAMNT_0024612375 /DNA_START=249 /DNA_END=1067 /DNA_ORIENTATION=+